MKIIVRIFIKLGFKRIGRCFSHDDCPYVIDFVAPPVAIRHESIRQFEILKTALGALELLTPIDCVKDHLCSFFHWNDAQALEQALLVAKDRVIDLANVKHWAKAEGHQDKLKQFLDRLSQ